MATIHRLTISPPLMNSSSAWASEDYQLRDLYNSRFTGAVTTRTATLGGFAEDPAVHTVAFLSDSASSLNSYGYSPHPLSQYLTWIEQLITSDPHSRKPIIISITSASPSILSEMLSMIQELRTRIGDGAGVGSRIAVELNTSCPNIKDTTPPAYEPASLYPLLDAMAMHYWLDPTLTLGLKLPPYMFAKQFAEMSGALASLSRARDAASYNPIAFLTCTNTVGSSLFFSEQIISPDPAASQASPYALPTILGGLAGDAIHALALGNVHTFATLLAAHDDAALRRIAIVGVGGVTSPAAVARMHKAGASVVGCATLFGREGVAAFEMLSREFS